MKKVKAHIAHPLRLYHVKGKKHVRVHIVPLSPSSLNSGDVFVLDNNGTVYVWNGIGSSAMVLFFLQKKRKNKNMEEGG